MAGRCISCGSFYDNDEFKDMIEFSSDCPECGGEISPVSDLLVHPWRKLEDKGYRVLAIEHKFAQFSDSVDCIVKIRFRDKFRGEVPEFPSGMQERSDKGTTLVCHAAEEDGDPDGLLCWMLSDILDWVRKLPNADDLDDEDSDEDDGHKDNVDYSYRGGFSDGYREGMRDAHLYCSRDDDENEDSDDYDQGYDDGYDDGYNDAISGMDHKDQLLLT